jgi:beta-N-acetylhexosaminidase
MLAHAVVPAIDQGSRKIATTSPKVVSEFLKHNLGFQGVVLTDALEMRGVTDLYSNEKDGGARAAVEAIKAGVDVLMIPQDIEATFNSIVAAVRTGEISEARIDESVRKILAMKEKAGLNKSRLVDIESVKVLFGRREAYEFAQEVSDQSITLVKDNGKLLPLQKQGADRTSSVGKLVLVISTDTYFSFLGRQLEQEILERRPNIRVFHLYNDGVGSVNPSVLKSDVRNADQVIVAAFVTHVPGRQIISRGQVVVPTSLMGASAKLIGDVISQNPENTVVVSLGSPYLIQNYPEIQSYVCTYSLASTAEVSTAKALFGEIQNQAKLPITIPNVAKRGYSLPWPAKMR